MASSATQEMKMDAELKHLYRTLNRVNKNITGKHEIECDEKKLASYNVQNIMNTIRVYMGDSTAYTFVNVISN